jgi:uncharacterized membrane-anchored protein YitT (DUF2179 family)
MSSTGKEEKFNIKEIGLLNVVYIIIGSLCAVIAIKVFMIPNHFIDGGIIGISIMLHEVFHFNISIQLLLYNIPFLILGHKKMGTQFAFMSILAIITFSLLLQLIQIEPFSGDKIIIAICSGILLGLAFGLVIKAGAVIDGLEILAEYTNKYIGLTSGEWVLFVNSIIIFSVSLLFGFEAGMYSLITYYTAMRVSDYVVDGINAYTSLTIISTKDSEIKELIVKQFGKAITVYKGERGYLPGKYDIKADCDIIVVIVSRLEILRLKKAIMFIDPLAFLIVNSINEVHGGVIKKLRSH